MCFMTGFKSDMYLQTVNRFNSDMYLQTKNLTVGDSTLLINTTAWLVQLVKCQSAVQEVEGLLAPD